MITHSTAMAPRRGRVLAAALATLGVVAALLPWGASPAQAAPRVSITGEPTIEGSSTLQLEGSGFQSVQGGFGGVYALFGWVDDPTGMSWSPSNGGVTGEDYRYVYDDESNPLGFQRFVTFPGSSTSAAANGGELRADGTWSSEIIIPGAVFTTYDRQLQVAEVDCTQVTCGIITIGAHGVQNANNESFTPVTWASSTPAAAPAAESPAPADAAPAAAPASAEPEDRATPATSTQTTGPQASSDGGTSMSEPGWLAALLPAVILLGLGLIVLAAGAGGYLAVKAILLGVHPEALEKVRGARERAGLRQRARQSRATARTRRRLELRGARELRRSEARIARTHLRGELEGARRGARPAPVDAGDPRMLDFFRSDVAPVPVDSPADASTGRPRRWQDDAPTLALSTSDARGEGRR